MDILILQNLLFVDGFPACLAITWMQLRCLAGEAGCTASFSSEELARLTGKSLATLYRHLRRLKDAGLLDWRCLASGLQIIFEVEQGRKLKACATECDAEGETKCETECETKCETECETKCVTECGTGERGAEAEGRSKEAELGGDAILRQDSQNCVCASSNLLKDSLINLTRVEAPFSKSRMAAISRSEVKFSAKPKKSAQDGPPLPADSPAAIYRQLARLTPNPAQRELLEKQVHDLPRWRETLEHWLAHRWNPRNLPGMLDLYRRGGAAECRYCPKPEAPKTSEAFKQLREQYGAGSMLPGSAIPATGGERGSAGAGLALPGSAIPATGAGVRGLGGTG